MSKTPILSLTSLRFFAAASIVYFHMQEPILQMKANPAFAIGVSFFFVLSGFILTYAHQGHVSWKRFAVSRASRLWPVHLVIAFLWISAATKGNLSAANIGLPEAANLLLLQSWVPISAFVFSLNPVSWSISAEVFFYALFPFVRGRRAYLSLVGVLAATACVLIILDSPSSPWPAASGNDGQFISPSHIALQFPPMRLAEFLIGITAAQWFIAKPMRRPTTLMEVIALVGVIIFWAVSEPYRQALRAAGLVNTAEWVSQAAGMPVFAFAIFVFAHQGGAISRVLQARLLVILGEISFSTYMVHFLILSVVSEQLRAGTLSVGEAAAVYITAAYTLSWVIWRCIEVPSKRQLLKLLGGKSERVDGRPAAY